jgi:LPS-assembly protein
MRHRHRALLSGAAVMLACLAATSLSSPALAIEDIPFVKPITKKPAAGTRVDVEADKITYDERSKLAVATGTVRVVYGPYVLTATRVAYDEDDDRFEANGSVELREPNGNILQADTAELWEKFKQGFARHVRALLTNDVTIAAEYAVRKDGYLTTYENAHYTACTNCSNEDGSPLWEIVTDQTTHDNDTHTLYHTNPRLKIGGTTVAWLPYAEHADPTVKRRTGWLIPSVKYGKQYGPGLVTPYFWALAPNYDLTARPMITAKQGPVADLEWRHRTLTGQYNVRGIGLYELSEDRWRGALQSTGQFKPNDDWTWGWEGTAWSDRRFLDEYDYNEGDIVTNEVYLTGLWDQTYINTSLLQFLTQDTDDNGSVLPVALPYVDGEHIFQNEVLGGQLGLKWNIYSLYRDDPDVPFTEVYHGTQQTRAVADLSWKTEMITGMGQVITPFAGLRSEITIGKEVPDGMGGFDDGTSAHLIPSAGVDLRWPFIASYDSGQSIFTPVFQLIAAGNEHNEDTGNENAISLNFDHTSLFLENRFTGMDRYEGGTRANVGFTYTFLGNNGGFLRASAGESFHIAGENSFTSTSGLDGAKSDLVGAISFQPWEELGISYEIRAEEDLSDINRHEAFASLTLDRFSGSLGYLNIDAEPTYGRDERQEAVEGTAKYRFSEAWSLFGGATYDLEHSLLLHTTAGVEFDCDCMNFKLSYSQDRAIDKDETDHILKMSIELRTIGATGLTGRF